MHTYTLCLNSIHYQILNYSLLQEFSICSRYEIELNLKRKKKMIRSKRFFRGFSHLHHLLRKIYLKRRKQVVKKEGKFQRLTWREYNAMTCKKMN